MLLLPLIKLVIGDNVFFLILNVLWCDGELWMFCDLIVNYECDCECFLWKSELIHPKKSTNHIFGKFPQRYAHHSSKLDVITIPERIYSDIAFLLCISFAFRFIKVCFAFSFSAEENIYIYNGRGPELPKKLFSEDTTFTGRETRLFRSTTNSPIVVYEQLGGQFSKLQPAYIRYRFVSSECTTQSHPYGSR